MDNEFPEDGVTEPKHVRAILMQILILFLRQSFVHSKVNKNFDNIKMCGMNVKIKTVYHTIQDHTQETTTGISTRFYIVS